MKLLALALLLVAISPNAFANVSGTWIGWGSWEYDGQGPDCPTMQISFEENAQELKRLGGTFDCGVVVLHSDPLRWTKSGNVLFLEGKVAGEVGNSGFVADEPYDDDVTVRTTFVREGGHADYEEIWTGKDGKKIYVIRGRLFLRGQ